MGVTIAEGMECVIDFLREACTWYVQLIIYIN